MIVLLTPSEHSVRVNVDHRDRVSSTAGMIAGAIAGMTVADRSDAIDVDSGLSHIVGVTVDVRDREVRSVVMQGRLASSVARTVDALSVSAVAVSITARIARAVLFVSSVASRVTAELIVRIGSGHQLLLHSFLHLRHLPFNSSMVSSRGVDPQLLAV